MKILVTGGNGFVGLNIVKALVTGGHSVKAYVRETANTAHLQPLTQDLFVGELTDSDRLCEAMREVDAVIHTAGNTSCNKKDLKLLHETNIVGTQRVVDAALQAGLSRFIFTSTTSTIGAKNSIDEQADESVPLEGFRATNIYGQSKIAAEQYVLSAVEKGLPAIILNPAEVVGPYDYNFQWGRIVLAVFYDQIPFVPPGGGSFCHAEDVGRAHLNALTKGSIGQKYILSGPSVTFKRYIDEIASQLDKRYTAPTEKYRNIYLKALAQETWPWLFKESPALESYRLNIFGGHYYFDSSKAIRELDYSVSSLSSMVSDCISWYRNNGFIS